MVFNCLLAWLKNTSPTHEFWDSIVENAISAADSCCYIKSDSDTYSDFARYSLTLFIELVKKIGYFDEAFIAASKYSGGSTGAIASCLSVLITQAVCGNDEDNKELPSAQSCDDKDDKQLENLKVLFETVKRGGSFKEAFEAARDGISSTDRSVREISLKIFDLLEEKKYL